VKLAYRVLLYSFTIIVLLVVAILAIVDNRLHNSILDETAASLEREARFVAFRWTAGDDPDSLADAAGKSLRRRVTLIDSTGVVVGDTEFDQPRLGQLANHLFRPEIKSASHSGVGSSRRISPSKGDEEIYVAVSVPPKGFARLSVSTRDVDAIFSRARRDILITGFIALIVATLVAAIFARRVSRPIVELRDIARSMADRNFRHAVVDAPGEVGELAITLDQLSRRLESLEGMRRDFVANVSHELRTPLTIVGGFSETLTDPHVPESSRREFATMILANTKRMQRIVDDLLDLSRIESGGWIPKRELIDIADAAREVITSLDRQAAAKSVSIRTYFPPAARTLYADPLAVTQILSNLVENAIRHSENGVVTVYSSADNSGIWLGVRDTGEGISEEHLPRIFERFYRADASRSREDGGTGLGLAIVRHLAEAHGGKAVAASRVGEGTTISVFLPSSESGL
jgi:signal transduction histidine kinase